MTNKTHNYLISYHFSLSDGKRSGFGECEFHLKYPIRSFKDIEYVKKMIIAGNEELKDCSIIILNFRKYDK